MGLMLGEARVRRLVQEPDLDGRQVRRLAQERRQRLLAARPARGAPPDRPAIRRGAGRWSSPPSPRWRSPPAAAPRARRPPRPRCRRAVTSASPRTPAPPIDNATRFSGWPSKRRRNASDQSTRKPQLDGTSGATATPFSTRSSAQSPVEPRRGQLAPPSASTVASAATTSSLPGASKTSRPSSSQPSQRRRVRNSTPMSASRPSQARSSGEAFMATGNTRPLEPT